jgi:hypothetical protein
LSRQAVAAIAQQFAANVERRRKPAGGAAGKKSQPNPSDVTGFTPVTAFRLFPYLEIQPVKHP